MKDCKLVATLMSDDVPIRTSRPPSPLLTLLFTVVLLGFYNILLLLSCHYCELYISIYTWSHIKITTRWSNKFFVMFKLGTCDMGIQLHCNTKLNLYAFANVDWVGCPTTYHSITRIFTLV